MSKSKMSRKIFIEAFLWVPRTRLTGDRAVRQLPPAGQPGATVQARARQF